MDFGLKYSSYTFHQSLSSLTNGTCAPTLIHHILRWVHLYSVFSIICLVLYWKGSSSLIWSLTVKKNVICSSSPLSSLTESDSWYHELIAHGLYHPEIYTAFRKKFVWLPEDIADLIRRYSVDTARKTDIGWLLNKGSVMERSISSVNAVMEFWEEQQHLVKLSTIL